MKKVRSVEYMYSAVWKSFLNFGSIKVISLYRKIQLTGRIQYGDNDT